MARYTLLKELTVLDEVYFIIQDSTTGYAKYVGSRVTEDKLNAIHQSPTARGSYPSLAALFEFINTEADKGGDPPVGEISEVTEADTISDLMNQYKLWELINE